MAHISSLMVHHTSAIMNPFDAFIYGDSPLSGHEGEGFTSDCNSTKAEEQPKFVWRMHQPSRSRKYNLFPSKSHEKLLITGPIIPSTQQKDNFGSELAAAMASVGQPKGNPQPLRAAASPKEQKTERRKKPSVAELGFMAAIHEAAMDSPTIPGRFPVHERSTSEPGHPSWRQSDSVACTTQPCATSNHCPNSRPQLQRRKSSSPSMKGMKSMESNQKLGKQLAPLIIPSQPEMFPKRALGRLSEQSVVSDEPPEVPPKSARMLPLSSPRSGSTAPSTAPLTSEGLTMSTFSPFTPFTPFSAPLDVPAMSFKSPDVTRAPPMPANITQEEDLTASVPSTALAALPETTSTLTPTPRFPSRSTSLKKMHNPIAKHGRQLSESSSMLLNVSRRSHKRVGSETSTIKQRGRAKQRPPPVSGFKPENSFDSLPSGLIAAEATKQMGLDEVRQLGEQAITQAVQFEVLATIHVKALSRELRSLDEQCEYLRITHRSLRSGRKNLHNRICDYLRSPRTAKFTFDSLLRQEESLIELDDSIDDWFAKLEIAENRRMRVRQKLLEHVAAALLLPTGPVAPSPTHTTYTTLTEVDTSLGLNKTKVPEDIVTPVSATKNRGPAWLDPMTPSTIRGEYIPPPEEQVPQVAFPSISSASHPITPTLGTHTMTTGSSHASSAILRATSPIASERLALPINCPLLSRPDITELESSQLCTPTLGCAGNVSIPQTVADQFALPQPKASQSNVQRPFFHITQPSLDKSNVTFNNVTFNLVPKSPTPSWLSPTNEIIKCYQRDRDSFASTAGRPSAESIRIYAGEEVYRLLADVEEQIERMSFLVEGRDRGEASGKGQSLATAGEKDEWKQGNAEEEETGLEFLKPVAFESVRKTSPLKNGGGGNKTQISECTL